MRGPGDVHRRGPGDVGDPLLGHDRERARGVEAVDQDRRGVHRGGQPEAGLQRVDVEERQHEEHHVVRAHRRRRDGRALPQVGEQRAVAEHRTARGAGRARGEHQQREVLALADGLDRAGAATAGDDRVPAGRVDQSPMRAGHRLLDDVRGQVVGDDRLGVAVPEHRGDLRRRVAGVDRHHDDARAQRAEVGGDEGRGVAQDQREAVAGVQVQLGAQAGRRGVDVAVELGPGERRRAAGHRTMPDGEVVASGSCGVTHAVGEVAVPAAGTGTTDAGLGH